MLFCARLCQRSISLQGARQSLLFCDEALKVEVKLLQLVEGGGYLRRAHRRSFPGALWQPFVGVGFYCTTANRRLQVSCSAGYPSLRVKVSSDAPCGCPGQTDATHKRTGHPQGASLLAP